MRLESGANLGLGANRYAQAKPYRQNASKKFKAYRNNSSGWRMSVKPPISKPSRVSWSQLSKRILQRAINSLEC